MVQTPRLRAFETNERRIGNFVGTMDPYFVGRNAAVLQYTRFAYTHQATRRRISNAATPVPGRFDEEWAGLGLAPMKMRGRTELSEASLVLTSLRPELKVGGTLQARTFLAPFGCEEIKVVPGEEEDGSAGTLIIPKFPEGADNENEDPQARRWICQKEMTDREEAVKRKNPCNNMQVSLVGKTTGHQQEEYPAWISISSVILRTTRIRWRRLSQQMKAFRHWNLRQPLQK